MVKTCTNCRYDKEGIPDMHCHGCYNYSKYEPKPQTNADRIRSMSDEELAEFLYHFHKCNHCNDNNYGLCKKCQLYGCSDGVLEWLKSEVKE